MPPGIVQLLASWYRITYAFVKWGMGWSACFGLYAGVWHGDVLSPVLFNMYIDCLLRRLQLSNMGCAIGSQFLVCIVYADDVLLLSPSVRDLQPTVDNTC